MGLFSYEPALQRTGLLVCDRCGHALTRDGQRSAKTVHDSDPDDLAPHFRWREDIDDAAAAAGWTLLRPGNAVGSLWFCPDCARRSRNPQE